MQTHTRGSTRMISQKGKVLATDGVRWINTGVVIDVVIPQDTWINT